MYSQLPFVLAYVVLNSKFMNIKVIKAKKNNNYNVYVAAYYIQLFIALSTPVRNMKN